MMILTPTPHLASAKRFAGMPLSPFVQELNKVVLTPDQEAALEALAQRIQKSPDVVKNLYRQERATHNMLAKRQGKAPIADADLLKEFETRDWTQRIGPRT